MTDVSPEEMLLEFKQHIKKIRLEEKEKNTEEKASMIMKQIKNSVPCR